ncbi:MAG: Uma2 family endonuclease, partial [Nannocystaceae bacterium]
SRSNVARDLWDKLRLYHQAGVLHYWVLDPDHRTLRVHRFAEPGYQVVLDVGRDAVVRAEPFEGIELRVADSFDDDER